MKQTKLSVAIKATLLGTAIASAPAAFASEKDILDTLKANGTISQAQYDELYEKASDSVTVSTKGGHLKFKSGDAKFQLGGRLMADYAAISDDRNLDGDGSEFRRARLFVKGQIFNDWGFKAQYDFAEDEVTAKDLYIAYDGFDSTSIKVGNTFMPSGLEAQTSSKYITFMERSMIQDVFAVGRKNGVSVTTNGDNWTLQGGLHMQGVSNANNGRDEDYGYGVRGTFAPLVGKTQAVHLGASYSHQEFDNNGTERFRARPEIHTINTRPFDTKIDGVESTDNYGLEAAAVMGPFSLQTEYFAKEVETANGDFDLDGWYAYGSYFLTGESRSYKGSKGVFGRVKPKSVVGKGGIGAWELGVRYSSIDLYDGLATVPGINTAGEEGEVLTIGVNWYATPTIRFMANYVQSTVEHTGTLLADEDIDAFQVRAQIDF